MNLVGFTASTNWIHNWKVKNRIRARKATKVMSRKEARSREELIQASNEFAVEIREIISQKGPDMVYNTDQTGIKLDMRPMFTLEEKGKRYVELEVQNKANLTHSYTLQPTLSASGKLLKPLFVVLQEPKGDFGPLVQRNMFKSDEIVVFATKSGSVDKPTVRKYFELFFNHPETNGSVLLIDSLTTYKDKAFMDLNKPPDFEYTIKTIPPGCTEFIQPLDACTNRTIKTMFRRFSREISAEQYDINLAQRNMRLQLVAQIFNQIRSPRFEDYGRYAYWKCGFLSDPQPTYIGPVEFCFETVAGNECSLCHKYSFIKCGWCCFYYCCFHFFFALEPHICENYFPNAPH